MPNLRRPDLFGKHVLFNPQLCGALGCSESNLCARCAVPTCAFCKLTTWKLSGECSVEIYPAVYIWRCGGCMIVGLQPIMEPDNIHGLETAIKKQHREALSHRCRVNAVPEYLRVR